MKKRFFLSGFVCLILAVGFWGYNHFFKSTNARLSTSDTFAAKRVMFIAHSLSVGGKGIFPIYQKMKEQGHDVKIVAIPNYGYGKLVENIDLPFFAQFDQADVIYPCGKEEPYKKCESLDSYKPDYIFSQNPFNIDGWVNSVLDPFLLRTHLKTMTPHLSYIVYGPHLFHQVASNHKRLSKDVDLVFVDSESTKKIYIEEYGFDAERVIVSGYQSYKDTKEAVKGQKPSGHKETILWMPRWALFTYHKEKFEGGSTFLNYHFFFYNYAKTHPEINFIIRPHMLLKSYAVEGQFMSQEDLDWILNRFKSLPNVRWSEHETSSLIDDIIESDIVVSDGTSALAEVVVADRPIIYLSNGWDTEFNSNDLGREFKDYLYFAHKAEHILRHLETIRKSDYLPYKKDKLKKREAFKKKLDPVEDPAAYITDYVSKH